MTRIPITVLEATLILGGGKDHADIAAVSGFRVVAPRMPPRRPVTLEEFEADTR